MFCVFYYFHFVYFNTHTTSQFQSDHSHAQSSAVTEPGTCAEGHFCVPPAPLIFAFLFSPPWPLGSALCRLRHNEWDSESVCRSKEFVCSHTSPRMGAQPSSPGYSKVLLLLRVYLLFLCLLHGPSNHRRVQFQKILTQPGESWEVTVREEEEGRSESIFDLGERLKILINL